ncbi:hypothetical protein [Kribbella sp. NPDC023855]|uniref:hypothetical protein n=1 Tax=Kribbella sp. NPDC023855 TaxID=3154698 RepID=UPI0033D673E4
MLTSAGPDQFELADQGVRAALWIAVRTLDEKTAGLLRSRLTVGQSEAGTPKTGEAP